jgi:predicted DNA-binding protein (UPF0251 family)
MPRPRHCRRVAYMPHVTFYKPQGVPLSILQHIALTVDELEAVRLADLEGLYQEQAAEKMNISRQTFGRIIDSAHKKIADALVNGKALSIEGGIVELDTTALPCPPHRFRRGHGGPGRRGRGFCGGR